MSAKKERRDESRREVGVRGRGKGTMSELSGGKLCKEEV